MRAGLCFEKREKQTDRFFNGKRICYGFPSAFFKKKTHLKNCTVHSGKVGATDQLH